jgi:hypothetical protein
MMREDNQDVSDWFAWGGLTRMLPQRVHGVTPDDVLGDLVRRPADASRNTATSLTRRTEEPSEEPPAHGDSALFSGQSEWHGGRFGIQETDQRGERVDGKERDGAERVAEFRQALEEAGVDPAYLDGVGFLAAVDASVGFRDRRFYPRDRPGNRQPYPPEDIPFERYKSF